MKMKDIFKNIGVILLGALFFLFALWYLVRSHVNIFNDFISWWKWVFSWIF